jgi:hypothetical protein
MLLALATALSSVDDRRKMMSDENFAMMSQKSTKHA